MHRSLLNSTRLVRLASVSARCAAFGPSIATRLAAPACFDLPLPARRLVSSSAALAQSLPAVQDLEEEPEEDPNAGADDFAPENRTPFATVEHAMHPLTYKAITKTSYKHTDMSPVQDVVLSLLPELAEPYKETDSQEGRQRDLLVRAKTGTGKTLAFLVPAIEARLKTLQAVGDEAVAASGLKGNERAERIVREKAEFAYARKHVGTLVISPTRELATQIANAALKLSKHHDFQVQLFVGGESKNMQMRDWRSGRKDIFVATPGRIMDMIESEPSVKAALTKINTLVLDEADTLLDMGFRADIESITSYLPPTPIRQTLLFSATVSPAIRQIAQSTLDKNFGYINCVNADDSPVHAHIPQYYTPLRSGADQMTHVARLIAQDQLMHPALSKIILFCNTTKSTQLVTDALRACRSALPDERTEILEIHSKKTQEQRTRVSETFRRKADGASVLVTSDVSARGVDYPDVTRVIQLGIPATSTQYIHRVGRTGRGKNTEGRGDLVLLPFETGFVKYSLSEVPIKPTGVDEVQNLVAELADQYDTNPQAFTRPGTAASNPTRNFNPRYGDRRPPRHVPSGPAFGKNLRQRMDSLDAAVSKAVENIEESVVSETFSSMIGFYAGRKQDIRCRGSDIVDGVERWCKEAFRVDPPRLSQSFLGKVGLVDGVQASPRDLRNRRGGYGGGGGMRRGNEWTTGDSRRPSSYGGFKPRWASRDDAGSDGGYSSDRRGGYGQPRSYGGGDRYGSARPAYEGGDRGGYRGDRDGGRRSGGRESRSAPSSETDELW